MQTFIFLCFDKKAVVYSVKGESVQECRFRGNEMLSLEWGDERFAEVWEYFEDVYGISSWENTEILMYCQDKKAYSLWGKMQYPVSQNIGGITVHEYNAVLFDLARFQGLLTDNGAVLSWRDYTWEIKDNKCVLTEEKSPQPLSDNDFVLLIAKFISARNRESQNIVASLEAETRQTEKLKEELVQTKAEYEQELRNTEEKHKKEVRDLKARYQNMLNKIKDESLPYNEFLQSGKAALVHPNFLNEYIQQRKILNWIDICEQRINNYIQENSGKDIVDRNALNLPIEPDNMITLSVYKNVSSMINKIGFEKETRRSVFLGISHLEEYSMAKLREDFKKLQNAVSELKKIYPPQMDNLFFLLYLVNNKEK